MLIELPCGVHHNKTIYDKVIVKALTGRQQNYLIDMELVAGNIGHIPKLLEDLTVQFQTTEGLPLDMAHKDAIWKLPTEDIEFILVKIREETFGPNFALPTSCPHCGKQQMKKIELDKIESRKLPDKAVRTKVIQLPKSGKEAEIKLMYLKDMFTLFKNFSEKKSELYTATVALTVKRIGDKEDITNDDLLDLPATDIKLIEDAYSEIHAEVDIKIINDCENPDCGKEYEVVLPVTDASFFAQSTTPLT